MPLDGVMIRRFLLSLCVMLVGLSTAIADPLDDVYVREFLRLTPSSVWSDAQFIRQLDDQYQQLIYDGLNPDSYRVKTLASLEAKVSAGGALTDPQRYEVAVSYLSALTDLHYGLTRKAEIESYLTYPEGKRSVIVDPSRILNLALSGIDDPVEAFALARPRYLPYQQLREAYQFSQIPKLQVVALAKRPMSLVRVVAPEPLTDDQQLKIQINLERFRRLSHKVTDKLLLVDIAGAELTLYDGATQPLVRQSSQIGRTDRQTPLMWSEITHITVNPSWTVPPTVYREDMLPQIRQSLSFLEDNQIQVLDFDGRPLNPAAINWRNPGRILLRQAPGTLNELGRIVVRFPNNEAIFLHDTPSQGYFSQNMRALSSGCIRLQQAPALAHKLLAASHTDAADRLDALLNSGTTQELFLDQPIPVLLAYWTVEADAEMGLHFRPDIYGLDAPMLNFFKDQAVLEDS